MSERYTTIATMLKDPSNLACILRELARLEKLKQTKIVPPPLFFDEGNKVIFPTFREYLRMKTLTCTNPQEIDYLMEIYYVGNDSWFICTPEGTEIGPFESRTKCIKEVYILLEDYLKLEEHPWTEEDLKKFVL